MMDPRTWFSNLTPYFIYILLVATLGPFLFGFHLVSHYPMPASYTYACTLANLSRPNSTHPKM